MIIEIKVIEWEKFQGRKKEKSCWWFKLDHGIMDHPKFSDFCSDDWAVFLYIMCQTSKSRLGTATINVQKSSGFLMQNDAAFLSTIYKLEKANFITVLEDKVKVTLEGFDAKKQTCYNGTDLDLDLEKEIHRAKKLKETTDKKPFSSTIVAGDRLEEIYKNYPRKIGKTPGMKKLAREIKTDEDFSLLAKAVKNYAETRKGEDIKFTMHWSTFAAQWRDWLEIKVPNKNIELTNFGAMVYQKPTGGSGGDDSAGGDFF